MADVSSPNEGPADVTVTNEPELTQRALQQQLAETEKTLAEVRQDRTRWRDIAFDLGLRSRRVILSAIAIVTALLIGGGFLFLGQFSDVKETQKRQQQSTSYNVRVTERNLCVGEYVSKTNVAGAEAEAAFRESFDPKLTPDEQAAQVVEARELNALHLAAAAKESLARGTPDQPSKLCPPPIPPAFIKHGESDTGDGDTSPLLVGVVVTGLLLVVIGLMLWGRLRGGGEIARMEKAATGRPPE